MVILVCRVSVLDLVNKMRGERVDCLCFREKSTILSSLLSRAAESDQPASNQTVISGSETAGQAGQAGLANSNLSSQVRAKKSAGVGSDPLPCGLQCKRIKQVRLQTCLCSGSALTFINPSQSLLVPPAVGSEADWQSCNDINPDEILSARFAGAGTRHDQRLRLNVITPAKRKRARLESSRLRAPNTISQSSLGTRNEGRRVSTSSRRK